MISKDQNQALIKKMVPVLRMGSPGNTCLTGFLKCHGPVTALFFCPPPSLNGSPYVVCLFLFLNYLLGSRRKIAHLSQVSRAKGGISK